MRRRPSARLPAILILLFANVALAALVYGEFANPERFIRRMHVNGDAVPQAGISLPTTGSQAAPAMPGESAFSVIAERPLFSTERRPPEKPETPPAGAAPPQAPPFEVIGIVGAGDDSVAILKDTSPAAQREPGVVVRVGDTAKGWTVEAIRPDEKLVVLVSGDRRHELELVDDETGPRPPGVRRPAVRPPVMRTPQPQVTAPAQPRLQPRPLAPDQTQQTQ